MKFVKIRNFFLLITGGIGVMVSGAGPGFFRRGERKIG